MRLIASDIDGTILGPDGKISLRTVEAFAAAAQAGVEIVFVTGRPPRWLEPIRAQIGHSGTVICSNGALSYDLGEEKITESHTLDWVTVERVREIVTALVPEPFFALESLTGFQVEEGFFGSQAPAVDADFGIGRLAPAMAADGIVKMLAVLHSGTADQFFQTVNPEIASLITATHSATELALLEMGPLGINKAVTLAHFAAARGIAAADVVAFGDMPNDVEMLGWAGAGYAMAGGHRQALAATKLHAPSLADDGVAQVIESRLAMLRLA